MALSLRQLRYFLAIAEAGAVSRAAERLNVAQSAISHHLAEIEKALGTRLFERRARGVAPTPAGSRLQEHAKAILAAIDKAEADVRTFTEAAAGPLSVGLSHTAVERVSLEVMTRVRADCPGVHMTLVEALSPTLVERVLAGSVDLALAYNPPRDPRLDVEAVLVEDLYLIGRADLIGASTRTVAFSRIPQDSVLGLNPVPASRAIIETQILRNQISSHPMLEVDSLSALRQALAAGLGCAILSRSTVLDDLAAKRFHARRIVEPGLTRTLYLIALAGRPRTRAFTEVRNAIIEIVQDAIGAGRWPAQRASR